MKIKINVLNVKKQEGNRGRGEVEARGRSFKTLQSDIFTRRLDLAFLLLITQINIHKPVQDITEHRARGTLWRFVALKVSHSSKMQT